ncbi:MAG: tetratricopeptide repeat protein [Planctomycetota bacterium]
MRRTTSTGGVMLAGVLSGVLGLAAPAARAQDTPAQQPREIDIAAVSARMLEQRAVRALLDGRFDEAREALERQVEAQPGSFAAWFNLACARAQLGELDSAEAALSEAVELGFCDGWTLAREPLLDPIREHGLIGDLLGKWPAVLEARRAANVERDGRLVGLRAEGRGRSERVTLDALRVEVLSAHDGVSTRQASGELGDIARFFYSEVFDPPGENVGAYTPWATVVLPDTRGFRSWIASEFGPRALTGLSGLGGVYDHDARRLVAQDLGATLRHEFVHVLHWREMERLGQTRAGRAHAAWIQEGLAALVEDVDRVGDRAGGRIEPVPSWRTNIVKRQLAGGRLPTLRDLTGLERGRFNTARPLARYAHARAVFMFLRERGQLRAFMDVYVRTIDNDPSGLAALGGVLEMTVDEVEAAFRAWLGALPAVPETGSDLSATLGVEIEEGSGDGPEVVGLPTGARSRTGLRLGSVITAIDGRPTRDMRELIRVLGSYRPGETVTLSHRRGRVHAASEVVLLARE